jgi:DNA-binding response OmpR family regulator
MTLDLSKMSILLVEDNPHMTHLLRGILKAFGIDQIEQAPDGGQALEILRKQPVDVAIVDWMMKPVDGIEFVRGIRRADDSPSPHLPIIMLTGHTERHRVEEARDAGVSEFLAKPVTAHGVYSRLQAIIESPRPFVRVGDYTGPDRRRKFEDFLDPKRATDEKE